MHLGDLAVGKKTSGLKLKSAPQAIASGRTKNEEGIKEMRRRREREKGKKGRKVRGRIFQPLPWLKPRSATERQSLSPH